MTQTPDQALVEDLNSHLALCRQALDLAERENAALRDQMPLAAAESNHAKRLLADKLGQSLDRLRRSRLIRQNCSLEEKRRIADIVRANQDLMLRAVILSRENERLLLEKGLFSPREMPSPNHQRPHFVAELYRRHSQA